MKNKNRKLELSLITLRINEWDLSQLRVKAEKYAEGNLSAWLRYCGRMYNPKKSERITLKAG